MNGRKILLSSFGSGIAIVSVDGPAAGSAAGLAGSYAANIVGGDGGPMTGTGIARCGESAFMCNTNGVVVLLFAGDITDVGSGGGRRGGSGDVDILPGYADCTTSDALLAK